MPYLENPDWIKERLGGHVVVETRNVRTFRVHSVNLRKTYIRTLMKEKARFAYNSDWAFSITWRPGAVFLAGDLGEMTLTHFHAMSDFDSTINWLCGSNFDYLMEKSNHSTVYDPVETAKEIIRWLNEPVIEAMRGVWSSRKKAWSGGALEEMRAARREAAEEGSGDFEEHIYGGHPWKIVTRQDAFGDKLRDIIEFPDHWERWVRAYLHLTGYDDSHLWAHSKAEKVLNAQTRIELRGELMEICERRDRALGFAWEVGLEDFYGFERYTDRDRIQIECIKFWADAMRRDRDSSISGDGSLHPIAEQAV